MNNIGIFGDSFATVNNTDCIGRSWPEMLSEKLNFKAYFYAEVGTSIWWSYRKFRTFHKKNDIIVFVYSQHNRWHQLPKELTNCHHLTTTGNTIPESTPEKEKIISIIQKAYPYISSETFDLFIFQTIFDNVNRICQENNIKIINIMPFINEDIPINILNRCGPILTGLIKIASIEKSKFTFEQQHSFNHMMMNGDKRPCHLNEYHNKVLSEIIFEEINRNDNRIINVSNDDRISDDPKYSTVYLI